MRLEPESDLQWAAFLYLTGELPPEEASSFELRLADDQDARDALTGAVGLAEALALVGPEFRPGRRPIGRRAVIAASAIAAAAACLALALIPGRRADRPDASEVAMAWSDLRGGGDPEWAAFPPGSPASGPAGAGPIAGSEDQVEGEEGPSGDRALPSWLLSAASAPLDEAPRVED